MSEKFSARECALIAAKAADEHKATDIMVLEVGQLVDVTEYFVIATARNTPHVGAILEAMEDALRIECGVKPFSREETKDHSLGATRLRQLRHRCIPARSTRVLSLGNALE